MGELVAVSIVHLMVPVPVPVPVPVQAQAQDKKHAGHGIMNGI